MALNLKNILNNLIDIKSVEYDRKYSRVAKLHKYWSRKPWFIIDNYISKYSKENDLVLDPFCGSGIIGLQSVLANRSFIGYDLNPFAVFLTKNTLELEYDSKSLDDDLLVIGGSVEKTIMSLYKVDDQYILYTILGKINKKNYNAVVANEYFQKKKKVTISSDILNPEINVPKNIKFPDMDFPTKFYKDRFSYKGVKRVSDMYTKRNIIALSALYNSINSLPLKNKNLLTLAFTNTLLHVSKLKSENVRPLSVNNFWIPDDFIEENVWWRFMDRVENIKKAKEVICEKAEKNNILKPSFKIYNKSSLTMPEVKSCSVDYLITDPPYGDSIQYSELSYIWNCWLEKEFNNKEEVIINPIQNKGVHEYYNQLVSFINEARRVLKKDAHFTLSFHNKDIKIWINLAKLIRDCGMELLDISSYDTFGSPCNKNWAKFSPKSDFYVTFINRKNKVSAASREINPNQIAREIIDYLGKNNGKVLDLNKAYDLFVGVVIAKIFDGYIIVGQEKLSIENIIKLFTELIGIQPTPVVRKGSPN